VKEQLIGASVRAGLGRQHPAAGAAEGPVVRWRTLCSTCCSTPSTVHMTSSVPLFGLFQPGVGISRGMHKTFSGSCLLT